MTTVKTPSTQSADSSRAIVGALIILALWNSAALLLDLWRPAWWLAAGVNFALIVLIASRVGDRVPAKHKRNYERLLAFGFPLLLLIVWEVIVRAGILNARWFPPPTAIFEGLVDLTVNYDRFNRTSLIGRPWLMPTQYADIGWQGVRALLDESHVWATLMRVLLGFLIGSLPGIIVGILMGVNNTIRVMLDSTLSAIYVLPKIAIFPLMMLVFPDPFGEGPKVAVVAISAFFLVAINTMTGVRGIEPVYLEAGRNYGASRWQMFWHVIIPGALPVIFSGLRLALGTALIVIVAVEFIRAKTGVGFVIYYHWQVLITEKMYAGLIVVMLLGVLLTAGLQWVERRVMPWKR